MKRKTKPINPEDAGAHPMSLLETTFRPLLSEEEYSRLKEEIDKPLLPTIRLNPLKAPADLSNRLSEKYGWNLDVISFCPQGFRVSTNNGPQVSSTLEHRIGLYYIQEAASMLPVELFTIDNNEEELTLDLAASPGGKTTHLVSRLKDHGVVMANDSSQGRIPALRIVLQNWGAVSSVITRFPGESFGAWFPEIFDRVLIDAPCSMQGLRTAESHPQRPVTEKESRQLASRQINLLQSALQAVKVGGEVVYSTCTLLPNEDEGVIDAILKKYNGSVRILDPQKVLPEPAPGITNWESHQYDPTLDQSIRLWPHRYHTAGFFACLLQKKAPLDLPTRNPPTHSMEKAGFFRVTYQEEKKLIHQVREDFGYDPTPYLETYNRALVVRNDKVFVFPGLFFDKFGSLPIQSAGMLLGETTPEGFLPSHEWVSRFGREFTKNVVFLDETQSDLWTAGENLATLSEPGSSNVRFRILFHPEGIPLGVGKVINTGLKNLLPRRFIL